MIMLMLNNDGLKRGDAEDVVQRCLVLFLSFFLGLSIFEMLSLEVVIVVVDVVTVVTVVVSLKI